MLRGIAQDELVLLLRRGVGARAPTCSKFRDSSFKDVDLNFDCAEYDDKLDMLRCMTQDELVLHLRRGEGAHAPSTSKFWGVSWRQGLILVDFSAQPEPFLTQNYPLHTP
jgi:hypothetical protein